MQEERPTLVLAASGPGEEPAPPPEPMLQVDHLVRGILAELDVAEGLSQLLRAADLIDLAGLEADAPIFRAVWEARPTLQRLRDQVEAERGSMESGAR